jgi:hypothetical protein
MLFSAWLPEAKLDVTLICTARLVNDKNFASSEFNTLPIHAHLPLPNISVCILDAYY